MFFLDDFNLLNCIKKCIFSIALELLFLRSPRWSIMPNKEFYFLKDTRFAAIFPIINFIVIQVLLALSSWLYDDIWNEQYAISGLTAAFLYVFLGNYFKLYDKYLKPRSKGMWTKIFSCWFLAFMLTIFLAFLRKNSAEHSRVILNIWFFSTLIVLYLWDYLWNYSLKRLHISGRKQLKVAIAGVNSFAFDLIDQIKNDEYSAGVVINGVYEDRSEHRLPKSQSHSYKIIGKFDKMIEDAKEAKFDVLFITLPFKAEERVKILLEYLKNTTVSVYIVPDSFIFELIRGDLSSYGKIPLIEIFDTPFFGINTIIKRIEDVVITLALLPIIIPIMAVIAVLVKVTSKGPALFVQNRYGINGETIKIWKFRSMTVCEDGVSIQQAHVNDVRITPLGKILRKTSMDELPQFINVLQGRLSVVGPRPHAVAHNEEYRELISGYMMRHKVKPGITGLAQINGFRGETKDIELMMKRIDYDVRYIREWSVGMDLDILLRTVVVVLLGKNAY